MEKSLKLRILLIVICMAIIIINVIFNKQLLTSIPIGLGFGIIVGHNLKQIL